jgi:hypothetical protein
MSLSEAQKYVVYTRECLRLVETADRSEDREKLIELFRIWMDAALREIRHGLEAERSKHGRLIRASAAARIQPSSNDIDPSLSNRDVRIQGGFGG